MKIFPEMLTEELSCLHSSTLNKYKIERENLSTPKK